MYISGDCMGWYVLIRAVSRYNHCHSIDNFYFHTTRTPRQTSNSYSPLNHWPVLPRGRPQIFTSRTTSSILDISYTHHHRDPAADSSSSGIGTDPALCWWISINTGKGTGNDLCSFDSIKALQVLQYRSGRSPCSSALTLHDQLRRSGTTVGRI